MLFLDHDCRSDAMPAIPDDIRKVCCFTASEMSMGAVVVTIITMKTKLQSEGLLKLVKTP